MVALILAAVLLVQADSAKLPARDDTVLYLVSRTTETRSEPRPDARSLVKLKAFDIVSGHERAPGWLEIDLSSAAGQVEGQWIPLDRENVVVGTVEALKYRVAKTQQTKWPERVRLDVARGIVRRGFTAEQVRLALGDPRDKHLRVESRDIAEEWIYDEMRVVVSMRGVIEIHADKR